MHYLYRNIAILLFCSSNEHQIRFCMTTKSALAIEFLDFLKSIEALEIPSDRLKHLDLLAEHSIEALTHGDTHLNWYFICTHNSRRSQFAQAIGHVLVNFIGLPIGCYSAGTEVTAVHKNVRSTLDRIGFSLRYLSEEALVANPIYVSRMAPSPNGELRLFSKSIQEIGGHARPFFAIMTCDDADQNCPFVPGALARFSLTYKDPKFSDGTQDAAEVYLNTCKRIASELWYVIQKIKNSLDEQ